jgi:hypothetical protein
MRTKRVDINGVVETVPMYPLSEPEEPRGGEFTEEQRAEVDDDLSRLLRLRAKLRRDKA